MSLDVYLELSEADVPASTGIFIREDGVTKKISREEWDRRFPDREPVVVAVPLGSDIVFHRNITHNLGLMASHAGLYNFLWHPEDMLIEYARELILPLSVGLEKLTGDPEYYKRFNPSNGWGAYEGLVDFVRDYHDACVEYPDALIVVSR